MKLNNNFAAKIAEFLKIANEIYLKYEPLE
jgi:hypothetical protein